MLIVADENIPSVHAAFSDFGEVKTLHGRKMTAADVADADILLVRSITPVNASLLAGSQVRFVGSATIGTDHVDRLWLESQGIEFVNAPGCNAVSAAEYVVSALFRLEQAKQFSLAGQTVGIIGCGNVGSRVKVRLEALGLTCLICDPPQAERQGGDGFVDMETIAQADIITLHVPLVATGDHPTRQMINGDFLHQMNPHTILINTSRGDVIDEAALKQRLQQQADFMAVLDVWENEPAIDPELVALAAIATPHIAGYSIDGKLRATQVLQQAVSVCLNQASDWDAQQQLPEPKKGKIKVTTGSDEVSALRQCMQQVYEVAEDDQALRKTGLLPEAERDHGFDLLRKQYRPRRECSAYQVQANHLSTEIIKALRVFGFQIK